MLSNKLGSDSEMKLTELYGFESLCKLLFSLANVDLERIWTTWSRLSFCTSNFTHVFSTMTKQRTQDNINNGNELLTCSGSQNMLQISSDFRFQGASVEAPKRCGWLPHFFLPLMQDTKGRRRGLAGFGAAAVGVPPLDKDCLAPLAGVNRRDSQTQSRKGWEASC